MARSPLAILGKAVAHYLSRPDPRYQPVTTCLPDALAAALKPGDVLLVEGNTRFSKAIKFDAIDMVPFGALHRVRRGIAG